MVNKLGSPAHAPAVGHSGPVSAAQVSLAIRKRRGRGRPAAGDGEMAACKLRADLDPRLLVLSIVSLAIFPFLTLPLTTQVFGVRNDEEFVERFLRHTAELLTRGAGPAAFSKTPTAFSI